MRLRAAAALTAFGIALTASPGHAAPFRFTDPAGDSLGRQSSLDIVWVDFRTAGTGRGRTYVPWDLVVTMRLDNLPLSAPGAQYAVAADVADCVFRVGWSPSADGVLAGPPATFQGYCDPSESELVPVEFETVGASMIWRVPISKLPKGMGLGSTYTSLRAYAGAGDPWVGTTWAVTDTAADEATTPQSWVLR